MNIYVSVASSFSSFLVLFFFSNSFLLNAALNLLVLLLNKNFLHCSLAEKISVYFHIFYDLNAPLLYIFLWTSLVNYLLLFTYFLVRNL